MFAEKWLIGLDNSLCDMTKEELDRLFTHTATACLKQTGVMDKFVSLKDNTNSADEFFQKLGAISTDIKTECITKEKVYIIHYLKCFCPLHNENGMKSHNLCECSKKSMEYKMNAVFGENKTKVELINNCIRGGNSCEYKVTLL